MEVMAAGEVVARLLGDRGQNPRPQMQKMVLLLGAPSLGVESTTKVQEKRLEIVIVKCVATVNVKTINFELFRSDSQILIITNR